MSIFKTRQVKQLKLSEGRVGQKTFEYMRNKMSSTTLFTATESAISEVRNIIVLYKKVMIEEEIEKEARI